MCQKKNSVYVNSGCTKLNLDHWRYQLDQVVTLLRVIVTKCSTDAEADTLVRIAFDKAAHITGQIGDVIAAEKAADSDVGQSEA